MRTPPSWAILCQRPLSGAKPKPSGTNNGTGMNLYPFAQHHIVVEGNVGAQNTTGTQHTMVADYGIGAESRHPPPSSQCSPITTLGPMLTLLAQAGTGGDNRRWHECRHGVAVGYQKAVSPAQN